MPELEKTVVVRIVPQVDSGAEKEASAKMDNLAKDRIANVKSGGGSGASGAPPTGGSAPSASVALGDQRSSAALANWTAGAAIRANAAQQGLARGIPGQIAAYQQGLAGSATVNGVDYSIPEMSLGQAFGLHSQIANKTAQQQRAEAHQANADTRAIARGAYCREYGYGSASHVMPYEREPQAIPRSGEGTRRQLESLDRAFAPIERAASRADAGQQRAAMRDEVERNRDFSMLDKAEGRMRSETNAKNQAIQAERDMAGIQSEADETPAAIRERMYGPGGPTNGSKGGNGGGNGKAANSAIGRLGLIGAAYFAYRGVDDVFQQTAQFTKWGRQEGRDEIDSMLESKRSYMADASDSMSGRFFNVIGSGAPGRFLKKYGIDFDYKGQEQDLYEAQVGRAAGKARFTALSFAAEQSQSNRESSRAGKRAMMTNPYRQEMQSAHDASVSEIDFYDNATFALSQKLPFATETERAELKVQIRARQDARHGMIAGSTAKMMGSMQRAALDQSMEYSGQYQSALSMRHREVGNYQQALTEELKGKYDPQYLNAAGDRGMIEVIQAQHLMEWRQGNWNINAIKSMATSSGNILSAAESGNMFEVQRQQAKATFEATKAGLGDSWGDRPEGKQAQNEYDTAMTEIARNVRLSRLGIDSGTYSAGLRGNFRPIEAGMTDIYNQGAIAAQATPELADSYKANTKANLGASFAHFAASLQMGGGAEGFSWQVAANGNETGYEGPDETARNFAKLTAAIDGQFTPLQGAYQPGFGN